MIKILNEDCIAGMQRMESNSIDIIVTDPPYLYLKHKLDRKFDEELFFSECKRVLKKNAAIVLFGRGSSFYRWNTTLSKIGFDFKEEIIWDKGFVSNPMGNLHRCHETISIHTIGKYKIKKTRVKYADIREFDFDRIEADVKRICSELKNKDVLSDLLLLVERGKLEQEQRRELKKNKNLLSTGVSMKGFNRGLETMNHILNGVVEKSVMKVKINRMNYIHPTQKPVALLKRILSILVASEANNDTIVLDPFGGSFSTMCAAIEAGVSGVSFEIDKEYFDLGVDFLHKNYGLYL